MSIWITIALDEVSYNPNESQHNATEVGAYSAPPDPLREGKRGKGKGGEGKAKGGDRQEGEEGRGGENDSDVQLEQGRRLAKAGHAIIIIQYYSVSLPVLRTPKYVTFNDREWPFYVKFCFMAQVRLESFCVDFANNCIRGI